MSSSPGEVTPAAVTHLAELAALPIPASRLPQLAALLSAWIPAANDLSARMQDEDLRGLMPAAVFGQGTERHVPGEER